MRILNIVTLLSSALLVTAHLSPTKRLSKRELAYKRDLQLAGSQCASRNAEHVVRAATSARNAKLAGRDLQTRSDPTFTVIQNSTCILMPEVTEGPFWVEGELVRQNLVDGEPGVPLSLDVGVISLTDCKPIAGAYVEIWHANATGYYSGYTALGPGGVLSGGETAAGGTNPGTNPVGGGGPSGHSKRDSHAALTDNINFGRGVQKTNAAGIVEFQTFVVGLYTGRTAHIHMKVYIGATTASNGTVTGGTIVHTGQLFFNATVKSLVYASSPYTTSVGTTNENDSIYQLEAANGNNPIPSFTMLGSNITAGLLGYITVGVDPTYTAASSSAPWYNTYGVTSTTTSAARKISFAGTASLVLLAAGQWLISMVL
ncbi:hypothetical protein HDU88_007377 [Geranomyces variabilis]|nr:hypothetical protein HDU88_007377 [Geranomyces variabilis]